MKTEDYLKMHEGKPLIVKIIRKGISVEKVTSNGDTISRQAVLSKIKEVCFSKEWVQFRVDKGSNGQRNFLILFQEKR